MGTLKEALDHGAEEPEARGPVPYDTESMTEAEIADVALTLVQTANEVREIPGADDVVRLALARARKILRLGVVETDTSDGSVVPISRKGSGA